MRQIVTGLDSSGRSCVVEELTNDEVGTGFATHTVFETRGGPAPPRPLDGGRFMDLGVPDGVARLIIVQWPPGMAAGMHHTDTVDIDTVLAGSIDLILDDGIHHLEAGDCAVVTGVDHAWQAGPGGCTTSVAIFGTPPPA